MKRLLLFNSLGTVRDTGPEKAVGRFPGKSRRQQDQPRQDMNVVEQAESTRPHSTQPEENGKASGGVE